MKAERIELRVHGIDHEQYFQGAGCGWGASAADVCYVGIGDSERAALDDALEQAACAGWSFDEPSLEGYSAVDAVGAYCERWAVERSESDAHVYASVRLWAERSAFASEGGAR